MPISVPNTDLIMLIIAGIMVEEGEDWKDVNIPDESAAPAAAAPAPSAAPPAAAAPPPPAPAAQPKAPADGATARANLIGPAVKLLLATHGLDVSQVVTHN